VKGARQRYTGNILADNLCRMIKLVLIMLGKMSDVNDDMVLSFMNKEWNMYEFVRELIQALIPGVQFGGGYGSHKKEDYRKETKVNIAYSLTVIGTLQLCTVCLFCS